ncbi:DoxX family protein [Mycetocola sp. 2940]|uniref:DoxX family protein n=1 Tax=Mycetocola sp. 2940 TaxID=3156452 RepID=UPI00339ABD43
MPAFRSALRQTIGLTLLRVVVGIIFVLHGAQKTFEQTFPGVQGFFESLGIPLAAVAAPAVSLLELVGGVLLIVGAFTRIIAALLTINMIVAIATFHAALGFFVDAGGYEFVLLLAAAAIAIALIGPGTFSVDELIASARRRRAAVVAAPEPVAV